MRSGIMARFFCAGFATVTLLLLGAFLAAYAWAEAQAAPTSPTGTSDIQTFPEPDAQVDSDAISKHRTIHRATIKVDETLTVDISERPQSDQNFDSLATVRRINEKPQLFWIGRLIHHRQLRLVHAALIRSDGHSGMLVLEFEGGAVGAREGFAVLRYTTKNFRLNVLPLTDYGKIVVFRNQPTVADIWSGDCADISSDAGGCEYRTRTCRWSDDGYACAASQKAKGLFNKGDISDPGIEIK
jgi:hypothetical protein